MWSVPARATEIATTAHSENPRAAPPAKPFGITRRDVRPVRRASSPSPARSGGPAVSSWIGLLRLARTLPGRERRVSGIASLACYCDKQWETARWIGLHVCGTCVPYPTLGESCDETPCVDDLVCRDGVCERPRELGELRIAEALRLGINRKTLYAMRDASVLEPVSRGVYRLASLEPLAYPDLVTVAKRVPHGVVCLIRAFPRDRSPRSTGSALRPGPWGSAPGVVWELRGRARGGRRRRSHRHMSRGQSRGQSPGRARADRGCRLGTAGPRARCPAIA